MKFIKSPTFLAILTGLFIVAFYFYSRPSEHQLISTWETWDKKITIYSQDETKDSYIIHWTCLEDSTIKGTVGSNFWPLQGQTTLYLPQNGSYRITIEGQFSGFAFYQNDVYSDKIKDISQWGTTVWASMKGAFCNCTKLNCSAKDAPNLSAVIDMSYAFYNATSFNANLNHWKVPQDATMKGLFHRAGISKQELDNWKLSEGQKEQIVLKNKPPQLICTWETNSQNQIIIPSQDSTKDNYIVYWTYLEDTIIKGSIGNIFWPCKDLTTLSLPKSGTYKIIIEGQFSGFAFIKDYLKEHNIKDISQWGSTVWASMYGAFYECKQLQFSAKDTPNLSEVTDMGFAFYNASYFNTNIN